MPIVKFVNHDGSSKEVEVAVGTSLMHAAMDNSIDGIIADCGGACSCGTCHCYIDEAWLEKTGKPEDIEKDTIEFALDAKPNSRLSCQVLMSDDLDGIVVNVPEHQY
ncbi:MAG: 2Fe-2S iron-sulfur cluster-binding protein [Spongiibacteraceae bacterium]